MIRFHPTNQTLISFAEGLIAPNESLIISAHCDLCVCCQSKVDSMIDSAAENVFDVETITPTTIDNELGNMFDAITSRPSSTLTSSSPPELLATLELNGMEFSIPNSLQRLCAHAGNWTQIVGHLWQAPVAIGGKNIANFIYMEKGGSVPEHTHIGHEHTLVLDGHFSDGINEYDTGDFISLNESNKHAPFTENDDGCLVFSVIDEPLHFTSGWAKIINPLSHLYFKVSTK
ncbi:ChrR family anti-sigma-E factor [Ningiella sp. W23]|uniref:ChrR family anti-sigma-E factor n=1 Tax=Ningiella sp. W23 TaxID=3023715 RepID=UPI0037577AAE